MCVDHIYNSHPIPFSFVLFFSLAEIFIPNFKNISEPVYVFNILNVLQYLKQMRFISYKYINLSSCM